MMTSMVRKSTLAVILGMAILTPGAARAQQPPTLGELARKEQERRKTLQPAARVVTNKDVPAAAPSAQAPAPAVPPPGEASAVPATKPEPAAVGEDTRDEAWWKARISQAREELRRNEMFAEALQTRINSLANDFASRDDPYQRARVAEDRAKAILEMDRVKADVEATRKKIAAIEEEARIAGVPPGWLR